MPKKSNGKNGTALMKFEDKYPVLAGSAQKAVELIQESLGGAEITPFDLDAVKMPTGGAVHWSIINEAGEEDTAKELTGIVVFQRRQRGFWINQVTPDGSPPDCFSDDAIIGMGDRTGSGEITKQDCKTCPFSQWGSKEGASRGQACNLKTVLFLLRSDEFLPTVIPLPPTSIKVWQKFVLRQAGRGNALTSYEVSLSLKKETGPFGPYSVIDIRKTRSLSDNEQKLLLSYAESLRSLFLTVRVDMSEGDGE